MIDKRIGKRFKESRERLGLTQQELAEKLKSLPKSEQKRILNLIEVYYKTIYINNGEK